jgi:hypothetical protein
MAPEQAQGFDIDPRTDVYSLGCVMYRMLTGQLPFDGTDLIDLLSKQVCEAPVPPRQRRPDLGILPGVERIILRAMEKDPARRFQSMDEMGEAIARERLTSSLMNAASSASHIRIDDPRPRAIARRRAIRPFAMVVFAASIVLAAGVYLFRPRPHGVLRLRFAPSAAADVYFDGGRIGGGVSSMDWHGPAGRHMVTVAAPGFLPANQEVTLGEGQVTELSIRLAPSPATGFEITSDPLDLPIWIDGKPATVAFGDRQARTPHTARWITPGPHVIEVRADDRVWQSKYVAQAEKIIPVHAVPPPPPPPKEKKARPKPRPIRWR